MHYAAHHNKKVCNFGVGGAFCVAEPGSGAFMVYTQKHSAIRTQILCKQNNIFFF